MQTLFKALCVQHVFFYENKEIKAYKRKQKKEKN